MMWEQIRSNRIRSLVLVAGMGAFLVLLGLLLGYVIAGSGIAGLVIALVIFGVMNLIAYTQGDSILLNVAGARKIKREDHPRLWNVVEEMQIASQLPKMPDIYIIDDPSLNAFATGRDINHASVAITSGLLQKLNRDELQGVIAHEMGHVKNRDVVLMAWCSVLLGTIVILSYYGSRFMMFGGMSGGSRRNSRDNNNGGGAAALIMILAFVLMILAPIFAQLIYFAVSRKREYLADASSALYTRNPEGLASALDKLAASTTPVKNANQATAPMYIVNPFRAKNLNDLTSTHPPIQERIRILRAMAGNASYTAYNEAFSQIKGKKGGIINPQTASLVGAVPVVRPAGADSGPIEPVSDKVERTREVSDMMLKLDNYEMIDCDCGARLKVPPALQGQTVRCPRCGRTHQT
ncbi:MAG: M48 family metallopeptidase [Dehalococcoidales bacterium]|nr:M48 family metallopeptidase [Dehalococcoidales bacterium]